MVFRHFTGRLRHHAGDFWHAAQDLYLLSRIRIGGGSYTDFYAARMDRKAQRLGSRLFGPPEQKTFQLKFLQAHGLHADTALLDYGCGGAAAGINFIQYLDPNRYTGADISRASLDIARA